MAEHSKSSNQGGLSSLLEQLPVDKLKDDAQHALKSFGDRTIANVGERVTEATDKLNDFASGDRPQAANTKADGGGEAGSEGDTSTAGAVKNALGVVKDKAAEAVGAAKQAIGTVKKSALSRSRSAQSER